MIEPRHYYTRPGWLCLVCNEPWPCAPRRLAFLERYTSGDEKLRLRGILGALSLDAERDLQLPREEAYQRFIAWTFAPAAAR